MVERDVVLAKVAAIDRCLGRVRQATGLDPASLDDPDRQDIFVLNLERAVQAAIDLAVHVVATSAWGLPDTLRENFRILEAHGVITPGLAARMRAMVGFRNVAVHDYQAIDVAVLRSILTSRLGDLEEFCRAVVAFLP